MSVLQLCWLLQRALVYEPAYVLSLLAPGPRRPCPMEGKGAPFLVTNLPVMPQLLWEDIVPVNWSPEILPERNIELVTLLLPLPLFVTGKIPLIELSKGEKLRFCSSTLAGLSP